MSRIEYKTRDQMKWMRESGLVVAEIHRSLREAVLVSRQLNSMK